MSPSVLVSLLLGSLYGLLWHAVAGRRWVQLPVYWFVGVLGFFVGYAAAITLGVELLRLGTVPLVEATLGSGIALAITWWLIGRRVRPLANEAG